MAAGQDDELGQYMLAEMYANGEGTTQDYYRAAEEYQKAVDGDVTSAFHALGNLYLYGLGVPQDSLKAVELFSQSAERGLSASCTSLGLIFFYGNGVPVHRSIGYAWLIQSVACEEDLEMKARAVDLCATLRSELSAAELSEAERMSRSIAVRLEEKSKPSKGSQPFGK